MNREHACRARGHGWLAALVVALLTSTASSTARAERFSCFRVVGAPQASAQGLAVKLCFDAAWPKNSAEANKGVEFAVYDRAPEPDTIRSAPQNLCFTAKDVPTSGMLDLKIPVDALERVKARPGQQVFLTGHWRNAPKGGVTATHVHGFRTREVPILLPMDLKLPAAKARQNSALGRAPSFTRPPSPRFAAPRSLPPRWREVRH